MNNECGECLAIERREALAIRFCRFWITWCVYSVLKDMPKIPQTIEGSKAVRDAVQRVTTAAELHGLISPEEV